VQLREFPEGATLWIGSLVRLQLLDLCKSSTAYERSHIIFYEILKFLTLGVDGEGCPRSGIGASSVENGKLIDKVVESGSEIVDAVANNQAQSGIEWSRLWKSEGGTLQSPFRLHLDLRGNNLSLRIQGGHSSGVQIKEVMLCSADLFSNSI